MSEGLLSGVLPFIFSQGDRLKRNINGWINDPAAKAEQTAGILYDNLNEQTRLQNQAFGDPKDPLRITDQRAFEAATNGILNGVMGFAPAGMTKLVGPLPEALEAARRNAVEMLGLSQNNTALERARAMGFDVDRQMYHGTNKRFDEFRPGREGVYFTDNKDLAREYGRNVKEVFLKPGAQKEFDAQGQGFSDPAAYRFLTDNTRRMRGDSSVAMNQFMDAPNPALEAPLSRVVAVNQPSQVRAVNAAFDPARVKDSNLLAGMLPLGALSGVSTVPPEFFTAPKKEKKKEPKK